MRISTICQLKFEMCILFRSSLFFQVQALIPLECLDRRLRQVQKLDFRVGRI